MVNVSQRLLKWCHSNDLIVNFELIRHRIIINQGFLILVLYRPFIHNVERLSNNFKILLSEHRKIFKVMFVNFSSLSIKVLNMNLAGDRLDLKT